MKNAFLFPIFSDIQIFVIFFLPFRTFQVQKDK